MTQIFNHRAADVVVSERARQRKAQPSTLGRADLVDPYRCSMPLYWVDEQACVRGTANAWDRRWILGFSKVTSPTNARTMNPVVFPSAGAGDSMPLVLGAKEASNYPVLYANLCAFVFDYVVRQKVGGVNLNFFLVNQCAAMPVDHLDEMCRWDSSQSIRDWVTVRVLELSYTAWNLEPFAADCRWIGPPFRWDDDRRFLLRCELDAAFFHLYLQTKEDGSWRPAGRSHGYRREETPEQLTQLKRHFATPLDAVAYIMHTFPIVRRKDEANHGEYRTKRTIIEIHDAMQQAMRARTPYRTPLTPPAADPRCCHLPRTIASTEPVPFYLSETFSSRVAASRDPATQDNSVCYTNYITHIAHCGKNHE